MSDHFAMYWPWYVPLGLLVLYELTAVRTQLLQSGRRIPTLSELVWKGYDRFPALKWIVLAGFAVLYLHFFHGLWR